MYNLFDSNPLVFMVVIVMGIVWLIFPFVVIARLGKIEGHLGAMRRERETKPPDPPAE
jgi:hypothetical protein